MIFMIKIRQNYKFSLNKFVAFLFALLMICVSSFDCLCVSANVIKSNVSAHDSVWDETNIHIIENQNEHNERIVSFDVSDNGLVALATTDRKILVMDNSGQLLKTFSFISDGSYYIQWNNDNLVLYIVRGEKSIEFTMESECVSVSKLSVAEANKIWNQLDQLKKIVVDDNIYEVKSEMGIINNVLFSSEYTKLVKADLDGNTIVLYNVSQKDIGDTSFIVLLILSFVVLIIIVIVVALYKSIKICRNKRR